MLEIKSRHLTWVGPNTCLVIKKRKKPVINLESKCCVLVERSSLIILWIEAHVSSVQQKGAIKKTNRLGFNGRFGQIAP